MRERIRSFLESSIFSDISSEIIRFISPSLRIHKALAPSGKKTYFGGVPDCHIGLSYPKFDPTECLLSRLDHSRRNRQGNSSFWDHEIEMLERQINEGCEVELSFLCQICLSEIPQSEHYPDTLNSGTLYFFADLSNNLIGWEKGCNGAWKVIFLESSASAVGSLRKKSENTDDILVTSITPYREMDFETVWRIGAPEQEFEVFNNLARKVNVSELHKALQNNFNLESHITFSRGIEHQLFGHPAYVQNLMQEECHEKFQNTHQHRAQTDQIDGDIGDWILLLQLDTDNELDWFFGDSGRLFFWIRKQDLAILNFSNVCCLMQSF